jgi:ClpP class serine protease
MIACCNKSNNTIWGKVKRGGEDVQPLQPFWIFLILISLQPVLQRQLLAQARKRALSQIAQERGSAVMTLIHRQETMSILGFPVMRYIDVDDSESLLRDIRATPSGIPIDVVLHTPGGLGDPVSAGARDARLGRSSPPAARHAPTSSNSANS